MNICKILIDHDKYAAKNVSGDNLKHAMMVSCIQKRSTKLTLHICSLSSRVILNLPLKVDVVDGILFGTTANAASRLAILRARAGAWNN